MNVSEIKKRANEILRNLSEENSYIEYKTSEAQKDKILKTLCAYANNYYDNDIQYIFIGVEEINDEKNKAIPKIPIKGIENGRLEKVKNELKSLRPFLYPNAVFEIISNQFEGKDYLVIVVLRQTGGPFMVSERAENDKKIKLKAGRYIRVEAESRLARVDEEYDLLRKFASFHYSSITNPDGSIDDLNADFLKEYILKTSDRKIMGELNKAQMAESLGLLDKNDPARRKVKNYALLMFADSPEKFIKYAYTELIIDMFGTKRKMESKIFKGPVWKQYGSIMTFINDNYLNTITVRDEGRAENRKIANFPFVAVEELVANALVHNNYENGKAIQIYISETQINIVNYNKPLPPLKIQDLNERTFFNERDTENPELRDMFKALGIIESFGTGLGEAKRALAENASPELFYKVFDTADSITSVVIPVNEEYLELKQSAKAKKNLGIQEQFQDLKERIQASDFSKTTKHNLIFLYEKIGDEIFGNSRVAEILQCSKTTATTYIEKLYSIKVIKPVEGQGKGKYRFT